MRSMIRALLDNGATVQVAGWGRCIVTGFALDFLVVHDNAGHHEEWSDNAILRSLEQGTLLLA